MARLLGGQRLTVRRREAGAGYSDDGGYRAGPVSELEVFGSLQPLTDRELQNLEEGQRVRAKHKLYVRRTEIDLQTADVQKETLADRVVDPENEEELVVYGTRGFPSSARLRHRRYLLLTPENG